MSDVQERGDGVVIVTGASGGLGRAIVARLLHDGHRVVGASRTCPPELERLVAENPERAWHVTLDLARPDELHAVAQEIVTRFGRPFGLVNNAAIAPSGVLATMHDAEIARLVQVNITSTILLTKYLLRPMLLQRRGRIVNVSSIIAATGYNGLSVYAASKAALVGFTRSLSRELGRAGITVNAVAPGYMATEMTAPIEGEQLDAIRRRSAMRALIEPADAAGAVSYLLGPDAERVTGTVLTVDAGSTA
jgi:3-oxoacyl-[acyl-carrier protein] reductase